MRGFASLYELIQGFASLYEASSPISSCTFAHVLGNIDILVPREASQEVEFVSKPLFVITFERRRKNRPRGGFRVARNGQMVAKTRFPKNVIKPV